MKSTKKINQITHEYFGFFQTELLQVDFMTFNLTKLSNLQISQLVTYFQNLAFNYYLKKKRKPVKFDKNITIRIIFKINLNSRLF